MDLGWETWASALFGAVLGMTAEGIFGFVRRVGARLFRKLTSGRRLKRHGLHSEIVQRGSEALLVLQSVPGGWRHDHVEILERTAAAPTEQLLREAAPELLPDDAIRLAGAIAAERARLASSPDGEWNGESLAVDGYSTTTRAGLREDPVLRVTTRRSDHAAQKVLTESWQQKFDSSESMPGLDFDSGSRPIPGMLNAVGLNATLVTSDGFLVLTKRSKSASSGRTGRHISVNEGMLPDDREAGRLSPYVGLRRGVKEELGIDVNLEDIALHTAMIDLRRYQFGLLGHIDLRNTDVTAADVIERRRLGAAIDRYENRSLDVIPWRKKDVESVLNEADWVAHGWLNLLLSASHSLGLDPGRVRDAYRRPTAPRDPGR